MNVSHNHAHNQGKVASKKIVFLDSSNFILNLVPENMPFTKYGLERKK
jgi:hypothetical protein